MEIQNQELPRERQLTLSDYIGIFLRNKWIILASVLGVFGSTAFYTQRQKPIYQASATIMLGEDKGMGQALLTFSNDFKQATKINNQVELLKSRFMAERVIETLFNSPYKDSLAFTQNLKSLEKNSSFYNAANYVRMRLGVAPVTNTEIMRLSFTAPSPFEAAYIVNTIAEVYQQQDQEYSQGEISQVVIFLRDQLAKKERDLQQSEEQLKAFQQQEKVFSLSGEASELVGQSAQFETAYSTASTELATFERRVEYLKNQLGQQKESLEKNIAEVSSPLIEQLRKQLAEIEWSIAVMESRGISQSEPEIQDKKQQLNAIKDRLMEETRKFILTGLTPNDPLSHTRELVSKIIEAETEIHSLRARTNALAKIVAEYSAKLEALPEQSLVLARMERNRKVDENVYIMMKEKYEESRITQAGQIGKVRILDHALEPGAPISPKVNRNLLLGLLLGLGLGIGIALIREYLDNSVRTIEDMEVIGLTTLGSIPTIKPEELNGALKQRQKMMDPDARHIEERLITHLRPKSPISEAYRTMRTNLQFARTDSHGVKTLIVTSAGPKEGKSTTIANLAITYAQMGNKTLLVDADLRRPVVHKLFDLERSIGLTNMIIGKGTLEEAVQHSGVENLSIITCGILPPNPSELLASQKMSQLIDTLKSQFEIILFDTPPVIAVTDAAVLAPLLDGVLFVVDAGNTQREALARAYTLLKNVKANILGALLNNIDTSNRYGSYYYYYYNYYYTPDGDKKRKKSHGKKSLIDVFNN